MASKITAAKMAAWSGVRVVIGAAHREGVLRGAIEGQPGIGTVVLPRDRRLSARKLWIAFAVGSSGRVVVDKGARRALETDGRSLLPAGVVEVRGAFAVEDAVEVADPDGEVFAKGLVRMGASTISSVAGQRSSALPPGAPPEVIHRDDLVLVPS
jgi:glutamate 5-kinase